MAHRSPSMPCVSAAKETDGNSSAFEQGGGPQGGNRSRDERIEAVFGADGPFGRAGYRTRCSQTDMAKSVAVAIGSKSALMAEAGTGTGKTFAYLVPALLWGGKTIISTGTKTLQDQLFSRDIPTVRRLLQSSGSVTLLKGRANYVCHYHLDRALSKGTMTSREDLAHLREIAHFIKNTATGDKSELPNIAENAPIWSVVTSTRENCRGAECAYAQECFLLKARKDAQKADLVVVNHHLFFADLALKETGTAELLPSADTVIFDEAHQLPETATLFFGDMISTSHILEWGRDVLAEGLAHIREAAWTKMISSLDTAVRNLRLALPREPVRLSLSQLRNTPEFAVALHNVRERLDNTNAVLEMHTERTESLKHSHKRGLELAKQLAGWGSDTPGPQSEKAIFWVETFATTLQLHRTPLSIAPKFNKQRSGKARAWIFTSATLAVKNNFEHFATQMGLYGEAAQTWPSPFDYANQGLLFVPHGLPAASCAEYTDAVIDCALPIIEAAGGRTFFLCTTLRAMRRAAERLATAFRKRGLAFPLFVQGEHGRTELLDRFRAAGNGVLIGSQSFWEGVDVRGDALSLVIIDKLPFAPPDDPVLAARIEVMERQGKNSFVHHSLPEAIINLKQGAGRLIRDEEDRGVLMICDERIVTKPYGKRIWQSLPPFKRTRDAAEVKHFFQMLAGRRRGAGSTPECHD